MNSVQYGQYDIPAAKDMLNLGCGQPGKEYLESAHNLYSEALKSPIPIDLLQYGIQSGHSHFKNMIVEMNNCYTGDNSMKEEEIYLTNGISQAMLMLTSIYRNSCEQAFIEDPTYFLMINVFKDSGYTIHSFNLDDDIENCIIRKLRDIIEARNPIEWMEQRARKLLIYIIPFHQNPTGRNITNIQIKQLVNLCNKYQNIIILSDETYQYLNFEGPLNSQKSLAIYHKNIISMGTMSKIFFPSIRVGFIYTKNTELINTLNVSGFMDSGGAVNALPAYHIAMVDRTKFYDNINNITASLYDKYKIIEKVLLKYPYAFSFEKPTGGYFIWVESKFCMAQQLLDIAEEYGVRFHIGKKFSTNKYETAHFRLSFSYYAKEDLEKYFEQRIDLIVEKVKLLYCPTVFLNGSSGKLGSLVAQELENNQLCNLVCLNRSYDNLDNYKGYISIAVDISSPEGTIMLVNKLIEKNIKIPVIIGTTGHTVKQLEYLNSTKLELLFCPNFSIGVTTVTNMLTNMNTEKNYWSTLNIVDEHHALKKDAPSGTAIKLMNCVSTIATTNNIESIRAGTTIGTHTVTFDAPCETIIITHIAKDRKLFAIGCVRKIINYFTPLHI